MAKLYYNNVKLYVAQYDMSGYHNGCEFERGCEADDATAFGATNRVEEPGGLEFAKIDLSGWLDMADGATEPVFNTNLDVDDVVTTIAPTGGADGERAYIMKSMEGMLSWGGQVGKLANHRASLKGKTLGYKGTILGTGAKTATGAGTSRDLGAVADGQYIYAALHVLSVSAGDAITVKIQSDADDAWGAGVTDRITFSEKSAAGSQWATAVAGPITDEYWRAYWTITGSDPSISIVVAVAIK